MKRGFTLLELLVVLGIIGILAAIIIAYVGYSRSLAVDSRTKATLSGVSQTIELEKTADYSNIFSNSKVAAPITDLATKMNLASGTYSYGSDATGYAIVFPFVAKSGYWCVDATNNPKQVTGLLNPSGPKNCDNIASGSGSLSITLTGANPVSCLNPINLWVEPSYTATDANGVDLTGSVTWSDVSSHPPITTTRTYSLTNGGVTVTAQRVFTNVCGS